MIIKIVLVNDTILKSTVIPQKISKSLKNRYLKKKCIAVFLQLSGLQKQNTSIIFTYTQLWTLAKKYR